MSALIGRIDPNLWTQVSSVIFLAAFIGLIGWVYSPHRTRSYKQAEQLPFDED